MRLGYCGRARPRLSAKKEKARKARRKRAERGVKRSAIGCRHPLGARVEPRSRPRPETWPDGDEEEE